MLEFSIVTISSFVGVLNEIVKYISKTVFKKDISKYIPLFSIGFGIILGIAGFYIPNVAMGNNVVEAIFIGLAAGSAATGFHQVGKQLAKGDDEAPVTITEEEDTDEEDIPVEDEYTLNEIPIDSEEAEESVETPERPLDEDIEDFDNYSEDE